MRLPVNVHHSAVLLPNLHHCTHLPLYLQWADVQDAVMYRVLMYLQWADVQDAVMYWVLMYLSKVAQLWPLPLHMCEYPERVKDGSAASL